MQEPNNLLDFMLRIGERTQHVLLGTATPIQTELRELWDLLTCSIPVPSSYSDAKPSGTG